MTANQLPGEQYQEFLALGFEAMRHDHNARAVKYLGQAMLVSGGAIDITDQIPYDLGKYYDHRAGLVTAAVEYAMPRGLPTINAQRVRVEHLLVGKPESGKNKADFDPDRSFDGVNVRVRYPLRGVQRATLLWRDVPEIEYWQVRSSTKDWEDNGESLANARSLARVMNWAVSDGAIVPVELHGKSTARDRLQAANLVGYHLFLGWLEQAGRHK